ncbi:winged helix-turn-helix transcriptional regulator [Rhizobium sp. Rhizsp82]|uniref:winged helix-turn-helix transcriptional regulator n=1 Tax=Rhizobium sp. Rhizsp82 TaxID=3243057 RepID=UPI0039B4A7EB
MLIVRDAFNGKQRFNEFQKSLGAAKNILSSRLKKLVDDGILKIVHEEDPRAGHRYLLTAKGEGLYVVLVALWQWGEQNCFESGVLDFAMVDKRNGMPLSPLALESADGRKLSPRDFKTVRLER